MFCMPHTRVEGRMSVGEEAPEFALENEDGRIVRLSDYKGTSPVVLFFYPADFTSVCTKEGTHHARHIGPMPD